MIKEDRLHDKTNENRILESTEKVSPDDVVTSVLLTDIHSSLV
jgi:hypothetical protein